MTKYLIEIMGGEIGIASTLGAGCVFSVDFDLSPADGCDLKPILFPYPAAARDGESNLC
jgi:hypothetical protein